MKNKEKRICSICGKEFTGYGNEPWPVKDVNGHTLTADDRCCDTCNFEIVIPLRISQLKKAK